MGYVITNVRVLDGTGGAPFPGTVRIDGNRIVECMIMKDGTLHKSPELTAPGSTGARAFA